MHVAYYLISVFLGACAGVGAGIAIPVIWAYVQPVQGSPHWIFLFITVPVGLFAGASYGAMLGNLMSKSSLGFSYLWKGEGLWLGLPLYVAGIVVFTLVGSFALKERRASNDMKQKITEQIKITREHIHANNWKAAIDSLNTDGRNLAFHHKQYMPPEWPQEFEKSMLDIPPEDVKKQNVISHVLSVINITTSGHILSRSFAYPNHMIEKFQTVLLFWEKNPEYLTTLTTMEKLKLHYFARLQSERSLLPFEELKNSYPLMATVLYSTDNADKVQAAIDKASSEELNNSLAPWGTPLHTTIISYVLSRFKESTTNSVDTYRRLKARGARLSPEEAQNPLVREVAEKMESH